MVKPVQICEKLQGKIASVERENPRPPLLNETPGVASTHQKHINEVHVRILVEK